LHYFATETTSDKFALQKLLLYSARKVIFEDLAKLIKADTYIQKLLFKIKDEDTLGRKKAKNSHPL
jgi:hypothetical protein